MMKQEQAVRIQAHLDHELSDKEAREVSQWLERDASARALYEELSRTTTLLAGNELAVKLPASREFYWSKIQREIIRQSPPARAEARGASPASRWLRLLAPVAGAAAICVVVVALLKSKPEPTALAGTGPEIECAIQEAQAITFHSQEAGIMVVWIDTTGE